MQQHSLLFLFGGVPLENHYLLLLEETRYRGRVVIINYQLLSLLGIGSVVSSIIIIIIKSFIKSFKDIREANRTIREGMCATLRALMINEYNKWEEKGYAPIYARESFQDMFDKYRALGGNGVMVDIHKKFFLLPTEPS